MVPAAVRVSDDVSVAEVLGAPQSCQTRSRAMTPASPHKITTLAGATRWSEHFAGSVASGAWPGVAVAAEA